MKRNQDETHFESEQPRTSAGAVAFKMNAEDFMQKPLIIEEFLRGLTTVLSNKNTNVVNNSLFFVKGKSGLERIDLKSISHIEAMADYVKIYTKTKGYTIHSTMKNIESKLPEVDFIRVHNSFIVRFDSISEIQEDNLTIERKRIPISHSYRKNFRRRLNILLKPLVINQSIYGQ